MYSNLNVGDLLYRSKGVVEHAGVYLGSNEVLHIQPGSRLVKVPFEQYANGKSVSVKRQKIDQQGFARRLSEVSQLGRVYCPISNNCEHTAHYLTSGKRVSPQLQVALGFGFWGGLIAAKGKASRFAIGAGLLGLGALIVSNANRRNDFVVDPKLPSIN